MWYNINQTLSHNCLLNFVVGPRGVGKTYAAKRKVIQNFLKDGSQFVYLRRYDTELKAKQLQNFFTDIQREFPDDTFEVRQQMFFINDEIAGWAIPLTKASQYKSVPFPGVTWIIYDEFIIDTGYIRYLPNEVQDFEEMYSTIARLRDVKVFFLSNAITFTNPYFLYFNVEVPKGKKKVFKRGDVLVEFVESPQYTEAFAQTRFGKIIADTEYGRYAMKNEFLRDNEKFVEKMPEGMDCRAILLADGISLGLFIGAPGWFVSEKYDPTCSRRIALKADQHNEETTLRIAAQNQILVEDLQQRFYRGELFFTSVKAKNVITNNLLLRR